MIAILSLVVETAIVKSEVYSLNLVLGFVSISFVSLRIRDKRAPLYPLLGVRVQRD